MNISRAVPSTSTVLFSIRLAHNTATPHNPESLWQRQEEGKIKKKQQKRFA